MTDTKIIVLVDDDPDFLESNKIMLEAFDFRVVTARNGAEALDLVSREHPDLMILDIMMTYETEGLDVAREVRSRPECKNMKILLVSGIVAEKRFKEMPEPDANWLPVERILEKPIEPSQLLNEIKKLLGTTPANT